MSTPTEYPSTFDGLLRLAAHLRGPDGCPWDREQSRRSMRRYILEECYERLQAIDADDNAEGVENLAWRNISSTIFFGINDWAIRELLRGVITTFRLSIFHGNPVPFHGVFSTPSKMISA